MKFGYMRVYTSLVTIMSLIGNEKIPRTLQSSGDLF
ncbi:hypothetical protein ABIC59_006118 [Priestia aryabhattai]